MSIESITKRIQDEARAYADERISAAKAEVDTILQETRIEAKKVKHDAELRAEKDSAVLIERRTSVAGLESRKMQLAAKQEVIGECFDAALDKLQNLGEEDYMKFLSSQLSAFAGEGGEIQLSADDLKKYGDRLAKEFAGKFTVGSEPAGIKGGFLLKQGNISINASIEKLVEDMKGNITGEIARMLFPQ